MTFFEDIDNECFHQELLEAYPNLSETGGFELLQTSQRSNKFLDAIPLPSSGYSIHYLKSIAAQAKICIRPIQQDLKVENIQEDGVKVLCIIIRHLLLCNFILSWILGGLVYTLGFIKLCSLIHILVDLK